MLEVNKFMMNGEQIDFQDAEAREEINEQVARLDRRVDDVDERVTSEADRLDGRIDTVNGRVTSEVARLEGEIDTEATRLDGRVDTVNGRVTSEATRLDGKIDTQGVPIGGADGQVLTKDGASNYATKWATPSSVIDDTATSTDTTWSSSKINNEINHTSQANVNISLGTFSTDYTVYREGNICSLRLEIDKRNTSVTLNNGIVQIAQLPQDFIPRHARFITVLGENSNVGNSIIYYPLMIVINTAGAISIKSNDSDMQSIKWIDTYLTWEV